MQNTCQCVAFCEVVEFRAFLGKQETETAFLHMDTVKSMKRSTDCSTGSKSNPKLS